MGKHTRVLSVTNRYIKSLYSEQFLDVNSSTRQLFENLFFKIIKRVKIVIIDYNIILRYFN